MKHTRGRWFWPIILAHSLHYVKTWRHPQNRKYITYRWRGHRGLGQGRIKTKLGLMLQPKRGLFFSALTFPSANSLTVFVKSRLRSSSCSMLISVSMQAEGETPHPSHDVQCYECLWHWSSADRQRQYEPRSVKNNAWCLNWMTAGK